MHRWTQIEKEEVNKYFGKFILLKSRPVKQDVIEAQQNSEISKIRKWSVIRDFVVNKIKHSLIINKIKVSIGF